MDSGYEAEPTEVDAVWKALIGGRGTDDDLEWWTHLSSRGALLTALARRVADERALVAACWHADGDSFAEIATRVGLTRARAQQMVERGRVVVFRLTQED